MMNRRPRLTSAFALALLMSLSMSAQAERTILNRADLPGAPNMEVISSILDVAPGETVPRHFHNGIESGYTIEGSMIQLPGKEPQMMAAGTSIWNLPSVFHGGFKVVGTKPLKLYTVHIVEKGKPLFDGTEPVK
ncbi:MAG TPA: cupin domain-containing protein [Telluria sp.]|nr:cupin domain-containing protein [Telluria sp.]